MLDQQTRIINGVRRDAKETALFELRDAVYPTTEHVLQDIRPMVNQMVEDALKNHVHSSINYLDGEISRVRESTNQAEILSVTANTTASEIRNMLITTQMEQKKLQEKIKAIQNESTEIELRMEALKTESKQVKTKHLNQRHLEEKVRRLDEELTQAVELIQKMSNILELSYRSQSCSDDFFDDQDISIPFIQHLPQPSPFLKKISNIGPFAN